MKIFMHLGLGKTGTSFMQSALALSTENLDSIGIHYPLRAGVQARAADGETTSGNTRPTIEGVQNRIKVARRKGFDQVLLSNEAFFKRLLKDFYLDTIVRAHPDTEAKLLMFIRNPFDHAISTYHQQVKGKGYSKSFEEFVQYYNLPSATANFINMTKDRDYCDLTVLNYDNNKQSLMQRFAEFLSVPLETFVLPERGIINRSMTRSELYLLSVFNRKIGKQTRFISNALCENTPNIRPQSPEASRPVIEEFYARVSDEVEDLNGVIDAGQQLEIPSLDEVLARFAADGESGGETISFSREQIDALADAIADRIPSEDD
jgi:hypothetical protein